MNVSRIMHRGFRRFRETGILAARIWRASGVVAALSLLAFGATPAAAHPGHLPEKTFGSTGSGAGQLSLTAFAYGETYGSGVAVNDETGSVYVADTGNHRVDEFTSAGAFVLAFGREVDATTKGDVCTAVSGDTCKAGVAGTAPGEFESPAFVAVDNACALHKPQALTGKACEEFDPSNGAVYVGDSGGGVVSKFSSGGALESGWGVEGQLRETPVIATGTGDLTEGSVVFHGDLSAGLVSQGSVVVTKGSKEVTGIKDAAVSRGHFVPGQEVISRVFPAGTVVEAVSAETVTLSAPATESGNELEAGSRTMTGVTVSNGGNFMVGMGLEANHGGIVNHITYITAVGAGTVTMSKPAYEERTNEEFVTDNKQASNLKTSSGEFVAGQFLSGAGIPAGEEIVEVGSQDGSENLLMSGLGGGATHAGTGVALSAKFVFESVEGVAVDASGNLWVASAAHSSSGEGFRNAVEEFSRGGGYLTSMVPAGGGIAVGLALDPYTDDLYLPGGSGVAEVEPSGKTVGDVEDSPRDGGAITGLAFDPATGGLYVDHGPSNAPGLEILHFASSCEPALGLCTPAEIFGAGSLAQGQGVAVGPGEIVYVADAGSAEVPGSKIVVYKSVELPDVVTGKPSAMTASAATLNGTVNPSGVKLSECFFEYGTSTAYGQKVACEESPEQIGSGTEPVAVHAALSGLAPAFYHFRLVAVNENGGERGPDGTVGASIDASLVESASFTEAELAGRIDPHGEAAPTGCELQYVDEATFAADQPEGFAHATSVPCEPATLSLGSGDQGVKVALSGLSSGTAYRFRFVASGGGHVTDGPASVLYTYSPLTFSGCANEGLRSEDKSLGLPDCRAYERVSPADNDEVYIASPPRGHREGAVTSAEAPTQAAPDGDAVVYLGEGGGAGEGEGTGNKFGGEGDEHLATRTAAGWSVRDIQPTGTGPSTVYEAFTEDLSGAFLKVGGRSTETFPAPLRSECLYTRAGAGSYSPVYESSECGHAVGGLTSQQPFFVGASSDGSDVLFESVNAAVKGAQLAPGHGHDNVYVSAGGQLNLVNVLPGSSPAPDPNATAGALSGESSLTTFNGAQVQPVSASNVLSADGSHAFWTDLGTGIVYVRVNPTAPQSRVNAGKCTVPADACTLQVSAGSATYQTATPDGRYAYYIENGELWRFDTETEAREALAAGAGAEALAVIGVNETGEDGSYLYFVAEGALAPGAEARRCVVANPNGSQREQADAAAEALGEAPAGRGCNVYVIHNGATSLVATLLAEDDNWAGNGIGEGHPLTGDWRPMLGNRTSELTPDGSHLVFQSERRLTAYDNVAGVASNSKCDTVGHAFYEHTCTEIYMYDAGSGQVSCVSCNPSGVPPAGPGIASEGLFTFLPFNPSSILHTPRVVSADGSRVFFNASQALLPAASSGTGGLEGVYEWERAKTGSCGKGSPLIGDGCLYLISGATSNSPAYLSAIDEKGENVFFVTRSQLVSSDQDEKPDLYDARVGGGFPGNVGEAVSEPPCESAEACKPPLSEPPVEALAASSVFNGAGNLVSPLSNELPAPPAEEKEAVKKPTKKAAGCKRGMVRKKGRCVAKRGKRKRSKAKKSGQKRRAK